MVLQMSSVLGWHLCLTLQSTNRSQVECSVFSTIEQFLNSPVNIFDFTVIFTEYPVEIVIEKS